VLALQDSVPAHDHRNQYRAPMQDRPLSAAPAPHLRRVYWAMITLMTRRLARPG